MKNKQYLLDTNILIELMSGNPIIINKLMSIGFERCCMSAISMHELYYGAFNANRKSEKHYLREVVRISKLIEKIQVYDLPGNASEYYGRIKYTLEKKGKRADEFDMVIAGHALCEKLIVVTDNLKHFEHIDGLTVENWV